MTIMETLEKKVAVVFAANGAIASEVALSLAEAGAEVFLSGRSINAVSELAEKINTTGGNAHAHQVDATCEKEIEDFIQHIILQRGRLDIVFNGIGLRATELQYGTPSTLLPFDKFMEAIRVHLGSQFLTSRIGAKYMMESRSKGTIITLTASLSRIKVPFMAGVTAACAGIEGLTRVLATEFGRAGIKVICLNPTALIGTRTIKETNALNAKTAGIPPEIFEEQLAQGYLLGKSPSTRDIGKFAAFLATEVGGLLNSHVVDADFGAQGVI
jgi:NAD(P)-dependent dehydrogenase (short-subunit alcohol dehydrogenase family)